ncbi:MAG TPA: hypothetical protein VF774_06675, partial [Pseudoduganella sp.]
GYRQQFNVRPAHECREPDTKSGAGVDWADWPCCVPTRLPIVPARTIANDERARLALEWLA